MGKRQTVKQGQDIFSSVEAMEYLGIDKTTYRYHVYDTGHLVPDFKFVHNVAFKKETLDEFKRLHMAEGLTVHEAAQYLGVSMNWLRNHLFNTKLLVPDGKIGKKAIFTKETLDAFRFLLPPKEEQVKEPANAQ